MTNGRWRGKTLDALTSEMAVLGGAVLGGGGGGKLETGLRLGQLAVELGEATLVELDSLPPQANLVALATFSASAVEEPSYRPRYYNLAIELLAANTGVEIAGLVNCGSGAVNTLVGWAQAALLGTPLVDVVFDQSAHPSAVMGLIERGIEDGGPLPVAIVSDDQRSGQRLEIFSRGASQLLVRMLQQDVAGSGRNFALTIGPFSPRWIREQGSLHLVSRAVDIGRAMIRAADDGGQATADAVARALGGQVIAFGAITGIMWQGAGSRAYGVIHLRDQENRPLELVFWHRYIALDVAGRRVATFPDLIVTLGAKGTPLSGEEVCKGQEVYVVVTPGRRFVPKKAAQRRAVYREIEDITGRPMLPFLVPDRSPASNANETKGGEAY